VTSIALPLSVKEYIGAGEVSKGGGKYSERDEHWSNWVRYVSDQRKIRPIRFSRVCHFRLGRASGDQDEISNTTHECLLRLRDWAILRAVSDSISNQSAVAVFLQQQEARLCKLGGH
jgi:hypothetical protein